MNCTLPDNSVHGILQERIQEWVAILFSRGYFQPKDWTQVSCIAGSFLNKSEPSGKPFFKDYWCGISLWIMEIFSTHLGKTGLVHGCCSVAQLCLTSCNTMDSSTPGFLVHHYIKKMAKKKKKKDGSMDMSPFRWRWYPNILSSVVRFFSCLQSFPASGSFPLKSVFRSCGQSIGVSTSTSVLPMNIQDWFPSGLTGLISLQSQGLSRVYSNTTVQKNQFFGTQLSLWSNSHLYITTGKTVTLTI